MASLSQTNAQFFKAELNFTISQSGKSQAVPVDGLLSTDKLLNIQGDAQMTFFSVVEDGSVQWANPWSTAGQTITETLYFLRESST